MSRADTAVDAVLTGATPRLTAADAVDLGATLFGVSARAARDLGSERDRAFVLHDDGGAPVAVLKVSNSAEDPEVLDMEAAAALHVSAVDPALRVALPWRPVSTSEPGPGTWRMTRRGCAPNGEGIGSGSTTSCPATAGCRLWS